MNQILDIAVKIAAIIAIIFYISNLTSRNESRGGYSIKQDKYIQVSLKK